MTPLQLQSASGAPPGKVADDFKEKALYFCAKRQELLAANIANADTPNYRALDVSFSDTLRSEMARGEVDAGALSTTSASHLTIGTGQPSTLAFARFVTPSQPSLDGNTVDMDRERGEFAQNAILYQFTLSLLDHETKEFKQISYQIAFIRLDMIFVHGLQGDVDEQFDRGR